MLSIGVRGISSCLFLSSLPMLPLYFLGPEHTALVVSIRSGLRPCLLGNLFWGSELV